MDMERPSTNFLQRVATTDDLFLRPFQSGEEIRVCSSVPLKGDFDRAAVRIAQSLDRLRRDRSMEERRGSFHIYPIDIKYCWWLLKAKYNPFGGMSRDERLAFDTIIDDSELAMEAGIDNPRVRVIYSNKGTEETSFHRDYGGDVRLLRAYNHSAMTVTDSSNVSACGEKPNCYSALDEKRVIQLKVGDYSLHRMMKTEHALPSCEYGAYHKATIKEFGATPRLLLCCD